MPAARSCRRVVARAARNWPSERRLGVCSQATTVLSAPHRLVDSDAFRVTVRSGHRSGSRTLVVHLARHESGGPVQVGFVVSKAVGNAVVRNRVKRRLRHLTREHLPTLQELPGSAVLVVRALPASAGASYAELGADLDRCLTRVMS